MSIGKNNRCYHWDLSFLFPNDMKAHNEGLKVVREARTLKRYSGKLRDPIILKEALDEYWDLTERLERVQYYSIMRFFTDDRDPKADSLNKSSDMFFSEFNKLTAFIISEISSFPDELIQNLVGYESLLEYDMFLRECLRYRPHTLSTDEERLLASLEPAFGAGEAVFNRLVSTSRQWPEIITSTGEKIRLDIDGYWSCMERPNRLERAKAYNTFNSFLGTNRDLFAETLYRQMQENVILAKARGYRSVLEKTLFPDNLPEEVYPRILDEIERGIPNYVAYLKILRRTLGVERIQEYDLNAPLRPSKATIFDYESACKLIVESLQCFGSEYVKKAATILAPESGWIDVFPREGKHGGTWVCFEVYGKDKRILFNFKGRAQDVIGLSHELGHALNSLFASAQPYAKARESRFIAEIAATVHEYLLTSHLCRIGYSDGPEAEASNYTRLFRKALRFSFERSLYSHVENGSPLTADIIDDENMNAYNWLYKQAKSEFDARSVALSSWANDSFLYSGYYSRNYITGHLIGMELAERISQDPQFPAEYVRRFLSPGCSRYPLDILSDVDIEITGRRAFKNAFRRMGRVLIPLGRS